MKNICKLVAVTAILASSLSGCAAPGRFEWGSYDSALYAYSKKPDQIGRYKSALIDAIARGRASNRLAPGLQAELGYCYLLEGNKSAAVAQFKAEMADFPESRAFLTKIVEKNGG